MTDIRAVTYEKGAAVSQSDTLADPAGPFAGIFTGSGGTIKLTTIQGDVLTLASVAAGIILPIATRNVWTTVTGATGLVGLQANPYRTPLNPGTGTVI